MDDDLRALGVWLQERLPDAPGLVLGHGGAPASGDAVPLAPRPSPFVRSAGLWPG